MSAAPTGAASASASVSAAVIVSMVGVFGEVKGLDLGKESLHM